MLVSRDPQLFEVDLAHAGSASDYRGPDFRKPVSRYFTDVYARNTRRVSDFPVFSGKYSTFSYLDETVHAVEDMLRKLGVSAGSYYDDVHALFFHRPYHLMPVQAMSFLYVRGLALGDHRQGELEELCALAGVSVSAVIREANSSPDLYAQVHAAGADLADPYHATSKVAGQLRKLDSFRGLLEAKMSLGSSGARALGNLYSAALPAWIAAGFSEALNSGAELAGRPMVAIGYGSGDAAEALPIRAASGWREAARRINIELALQDAIDLTQEQYEALHDGDEVRGLVYEPSGEFVISRVGSAYGPTFQDLGVEYYEYV